MLYLDIFNTDYISKTPLSGIVLPSDLPYLKRLYHFNRDSIQSYYQSRNFSVKNTHIISRLLEHFPSFFQYDSFRYLEVANDKTKYLAKHFKFTSSIEKGIVHPSYFFGNEGEELIISSYENFDVNNTVHQWKTDAPISVLKHNRNDIKLLLPMGNNDESRSGLDVVLINIPRLSLKYREFLREQYQNSTTGEGLVLNKNHFIIKYLLPTMMEDVIDHVFLNKIMDKFYGKEEVVPKFKHRFKLFEPTTQIERYIKNTLDVITNKKTDFINLLRNMQLIFKKDASELLALNDLGVTRQVKWSIIASRLDYMLFLYDISKSKDINQHYINDWKKLILRIKNDKSMMDMFSYQTNKELEEKMYKISQM